MSAFLVQVIYLIRHGNTTMNSGAAFRPFDIQEEIRKKDAEVAISTVAARTDSSGRIFDVPLSPLGLKQAAGLKPKLPGMKAEVVSVSSWPCCGSVRYGFCFFDGKRLHPTWEGLLSVSTSCGQPGGPLGLSCSYHVLDSSLVCNQLETADTFAKGQWYP